MFSRVKTSSPAHIKTPRGTGSLQSTPPPFRWASLFSKPIVNPVNYKSYTLPIFNLSNQYSINFHLAWLGFFVAFLVCRIHHLFANLALVSLAEISLGLLRLSSPGSPSLPSWMKLSGPTSSLLDRRLATQTVSLPLRVDAEGSLGLCTYIRASFPSYSRCSMCYCAFFILTSLSSES
jgi:hypothetical protein